MRHFNQKVVRNTQIDGDEDYGSFCARCKDRPLYEFWATMYPPGVHILLHYPFTGYLQCPDLPDVTPCKGVQVQLVYIWWREKNEDCETELEPFKVMVEPCPTFQRPYGTVRTWCDKGIDFLAVRGDFFYAWYGPLYTASYADIIDEYYEGVNYADQHPWVFEREHRGYQKWWFVNENWDRFPQPDHDPEDCMEEGCVVTKNKYVLSSTDCHAEWVFEEASVHQLESCEEEKEDCWNTSVTLPLYSRLSSHNGDRQYAYGCWEAVEWPECSSVPPDCFVREECPDLDVKCLKYWARTKSLWEFNTEDWKWENLYTALFTAKESDIEKTTYTCSTIQPEKLRAEYESAPVYSHIHNCDDKEPELLTDVYNWQKTVTYRADVETSPCEVLWDRISEKCKEVPSPITSCSYVTWEQYGRWYCSVSFPSEEFEYNYCVGPFPECDEFSETACEPEVEAYTLSIWLRHPFTDEYILQTEYLVLGSNYKRRFSRSCVGEDERVVVREKSFVSSSHVCDSEKPDLPVMGKRFIACMQEFNLIKEELYMGWDRPGEEPYVSITETGEDNHHMIENRCIVQSDTEETDIEECSDFPEKHCTDYTGALCEFDAYTYIEMQLVEEDGDWETLERYLVRGVHSDYTNYSCDPDNPEIQRVVAYIQDQKASEHFAAEFTPTTQMEIRNMRKTVLYKGAYRTCSFKWELFEGVFDGRIYPYYTNKYSAIPEASIDTSRPATQTVTSASVRFSMPKCLPFTKGDYIIDPEPILEIEAYTVSVWSRELSETTYTERTSEAYLAYGTSPSGTVGSSLDLHVDRECENGDTEIATVYGKSSYAMEHECSSTMPDLPPYYIGCSKEWTATKTGSCTAEWMLVNSNPPDIVRSKTNSVKEVLLNNGNIVVQWGFEPDSTGICAGAQPECIAEDCPYPTTGFDAYTLTTWEWKITDNDWGSEVSELVIGSNTNEEPDIVCTECDGTKCLTQEKKSLSTNSDAFYVCHSVDPSDPPMNTYYIARRQRYVGVYSDCTFQYELDTDECINYGMEYNGGVTDSYIPTSGSASQSGIFQELTGSTKKYEYPACFLLNELELTCEDSAMPNLLSSYMHTESSWRREGEAAYENTAIDLFFGRLTGPEEPVRSCDGEIEIVDFVIGYNLLDTIHTCDYTEPPFPPGVTEFAACQTRFPPQITYTQYHGRNYETGRIWAPSSSTIKIQVSGPEAAGSIVSEATEECIVTWNVQEVTITNICNELGSIDCSGSVSANCSYHMYTYAIWTRLRCSEQWELYEMSLHFGPYWERTILDPYIVGDYVRVEIYEQSIDATEHTAYSEPPSDGIYEMQTVYLAVRDVATITREQTGLPEVFDCTVCCMPFGFLYSDYIVGSGYGYDGRVIDNGQQSIRTPYWCTRTSQRIVAWTTDPNWGVIQSTRNEMVLFGCIGIIEIVREDPPIVVEYDCSEFQGSCHLNHPVGTTCRNAG